MATLVGILGVLAGAFVKGAVGFGFPTVATPILALFMDVKSAVAVLIVPNLVMDTIQALRHPGLLHILRRHAALNVCGIAGTFVGTALLRLIPDRTALLILGVVVIVFAAIGAAGISFRVSARWEPILSPPVGFLAGVVGGVTNVPGTPLTLYFYALVMDKPTFVRSIAVSFIIYKTTQLVAVVAAGFMTAERLGLSIVATLVGLGAFRLGLAVQDRLSQRAFNLTVLWLLGALGVFLVYRGIG